MTAISELQLDIEPIAGLLGAKVHGVVGSALTAETLAQVRQALDDHLVVILPGMHPTPSELRDLALAFGDLEEHPYLPKVDDSVPEVVVLDASKTPAADIWHTDATFLESPPIAGMLHMVECPPSGGDTMWINCYEVFESLSEPMQELLLGLTCHHDDGGQGTRKAEHPVVRTHPQTGRRALYVNNQFGRRIPQLSRPESQMLLTHLYQWQEQIRFSCRWSWSAGDVVIWDERVTLHAVVDDVPDGESRILHRVTVMGDDPQAAGDTTRWSNHRGNKMASSGYYGITNRSAEF